MPLELLYSHTLAFANQAAYEAEFPYDPPTDLSTSVTPSTAYGATAGPDGGPGVYKTGGSGAFGFDKMAMVPQGHLFRLKARYNTLSTGGAGLSMALFFVDPGNRATSFEGNLVSAAHSIAGQILVTVKTIPPYHTGAANTYSESYPAVFTPGTPYDLRIDGRRSTIQEVSPGVFAPDADGWIEVYLNDVQIGAFGPMPIWLNESTLGENGAGYYWNCARWGTNGSVSHVEVWHEPDDPDPPVTKNGGECCGIEEPSGGVPTPSTGATPIEDPTAEEPVEWHRFCTGGGVPPSGADPTHSESWYA